MLDTQTDSETDHATVRLNWQVIDPRCEALGAATGEQQARLLGCSRAQLYRWRNGTNDIGLHRAIDLASRIGLELGDIVASKPPRDPKDPPKPPSKPPARPRPPAGPGNPKPPPGPKENER